MGVRRIETAMPFIASFKQTRVIAFDIPGVGEPPAPLLPDRLSHVAPLAARLLDHLGVECADVFGVSWGGAAAQEFAIRHASRCRTVTLAATSAGFVMGPGQPGVLLKLLSPRRHFDPPPGSAHGSLVRSTPCSGHCTRGGRERRRVWK